jgi:hypothetical protein
MSFRNLSLSILLKEGFFTGLFIFGCLFINVHWNIHLLLARTCESTQSIFLIILDTGQVKCNIMFGSNRRGNDFWRSFTSYRDSLLLMFTWCKNTFPVSIIFHKRKCYYFQTFDGKEYVQDFFILIKSLVSVKIVYSLIESNSNVGIGILLCKLF